MKALFIGDSITEGFDLHHHFPGQGFVNHGYSGYSSEEVLNIMSGEWFAVNPDVVFICLGTNDLARSAGADEIVRNLEMMINNISIHAPSAKIYLTSLFPTRHNQPRPNPVIRNLNAQLHALALKLQVNYLHLHPFFSDVNGQLKLGYTNDGLHLNNKAYKMWAKLVCLLAGIE
jgi:lysophospholipase L1-like esterase